MNITLKINLNIFDILKLLHFFIVFNYGKEMFEFIKEVLQIKSIVTMISFELEGL